MAPADAMQATNRKQVTFFLLFRQGEIPLDQEKQFSLIQIFIEENRFAPRAWFFTKPE